MTMDVEAEIRDLKRRVNEIEGSSGFLTGQIKAVHKDLLAFQARMERFQARTEQEFGKVNGRLDRVEREVQGLRGLREDIPGIVRDALRETMPAVVRNAVRAALREDRGKSRKTQ